MDVNELEDLLSRLMRSAVLGLVNYIRESQTVILPLPYEDATYSLVSSNSTEANRADADIHPMKRKDVITEGLQTAMDQLSYYGVSTEIAYYIASRIETMCLDQLMVFAPFLGTEGYQLMSFNLLGDYCLGMEICELWSKPSSSQ